MTNCLEDLPAVAMRIQYTVVVRQRFFHFYKKMETPLSLRSPASTAVERAGIIRIFQYVSTAMKVNCLYANAMKHLRLWKSTLVYFVDA